MDVPYASDPCLNTPLHSTDRPDSRRLTLVIFSASTPACRCSDSWFIRWWRAWRRASAASRVAGSRRATLELRAATAESSERCRVSADRRLWKGGGGRRQGPASEDPAVSGSGVEADIRVGYERPSNGDPLEKNEVIKT